MNTGFLGPAVATVLTVYGIETITPWNRSLACTRLQQCLPFTVLKRTHYITSFIITVSKLQQCLPFTVLKQEQMLFQDVLLYVKLQQCLPFTVLKRRI